MTISLDDQGLRYSFSSDLSYATLVDIWKNFACLRSTLAER